MASKTTKATTLHVCVECDAQHPKWAGQCSGCGAWNTLEPVAAGSDVNAVASSPRPVPIGEVGCQDAAPVTTGIGELDRVLGGGLVPGSVTLLGGEPGIGKSTLLLQLLASLPGPTLYVSAEESAQQVRRRAERVDAVVPGLWLLSETSLAGVVDAISEIRPAVAVVDSIQTIADPSGGSPPGSIAQVRNCTNRLVALAKANDVATLLVGHVTKEGGLAGPRVLEHIVDTVLQFEGDRHHALRLLRASKHRFGPTDELGLFEMAEAGLRSVPDPSTMFLADRRPGVAGSAVVPTMEGQRPIVVEVQALTSPGVPNVPSRRSAQGLDGGRLSMLAAVIGRRRLVDVGDHDIYASTAGGAKLREPGLDLGVCLAIVSALVDRPLPADLAVFGEVGLGGEVRQVAHGGRRMTEARRLGFRRALVPANSPESSSDLEVLRIGTLAEAIAVTGLGARTPVEVQPTSTELHAV